MTVKREGTEVRGDGKVGFGNIHELCRLQLSYLRDIGSDGLHVEFDPDSLNQSHHHRRLAYFETTHKEYFVQMEIVSLQFDHGFSDAYRQKRPERIHTGQDYHSERTFCHK
jgi:hypothetical protein